MLDDSTGVAGPPWRVANVPRQKLSLQVRPIPSILITPGLTGRIAIPPYRLAWEKAGLDGDTVFREVF